VANTKGGVLGEVRVGEAIGSGFRLIAAHPLAFAGWVAVYILLNAGPALLSMGILGDDYIRLLRTEADGATDMSAFQAMAQQSQIVNGVSLLGSLALYAILYGAIFRAVVEPQNARFGYLRLGIDEVRQAVLLTVIFIAAMAAGVAIGIVTGLLIGSMALASPVAALIFGLVIGVGILIATLWIMARLSMMFPMTLARKQLCFR